jgi:uncharacterized protein YhhL (DUF1145 family)
MPYHQTALTIWVFVVVMKSVCCDRTAQIVDAIYVKFAILDHSMSLAVSRGLLPAENVVQPRDLRSTKWH